MILERKEWLGDKDGRTYKINTDDERIITEKNLSGMTDIEKERFIDKALDDFSDGYNMLEEINGELYEVYENERIKITRKAYL